MVTGKDAWPLILIDVGGVFLPGFRCRPPRCRCHRQRAGRRIRVRGEEYRVSGGCSGSSLGRNRPPLRPRRPLAAP